MIRHADTEFANNARAAIEERVSRGLTLQIGAIGLLLFTFLIWARWATLAEVATGVGKVIPSRQLQVVQSLEGGIVSQIQVSEGQSVEEGQPLMRIDDTGFASRLGEIAKRRAAISAEIARLEAEAAGRSEVSFPAELHKESPAAIALENETFRARSARLENEVSILRQQLGQREQEIQELEARRAKAQATLAPLTRELALNRNLAGRGAVAEVEVLRLERQAAELNGDLKVVQAALPRAQAAIAEAKTKIDGVRAIFLAQVRERLAIVQADAAVIDESIKGAKDRVARTTLRSPVRGVVNKVAVTTLGAVVQPGQSLVEIVPLDDTLLIEARVRPQDVAFIRPAQPASVKLTAYDYLVYGALAGKVERIGADTITDQRGETFFQVIVRTERNWLGTPESKLTVIPGMVASVDIESGQKTVLDYLLKPVLRVRHEALRER
jgi:adhesin transport system membrane fusion protein